MKAIGIGCVALALMALASACSGDEPTRDDATRGERIDYGPAPEQFGELYIPEALGAEDAGLLPLVVLVHGGFWRDQFTLELMAPLADDLMARGYGVWNIEYRKVGEPGGGYPGTLEDVAAAVDRLATLADARRIDLERVAIVGHSAGGQLALWVGQRERLPAGSPGSNPDVRVSLAVGLAPVPDLVAAHEQDVGGTAVRELMGGLPSELPDEYAIASPAALLPIAADQLIVHGDLDTIVPASLSVDYALLAASEQLGLLRFTDADHFDVIDPASEAWADVADALAERFGRSR